MAVVAEPAKKSITTSLPSTKKLTKYLIRLIGFGWLKKSPPIKDDNSDDAYSLVLTEQEFLSIKGDVYWLLIKLVGRLKPSSSLMNLIDNLSDLTMNFVPFSNSFSRKSLVHLNSPVKVTSSVAYPFTIWISWTSCTRSSLPACRTPLSRKLKNTLSLGNTRVLIAFPRLRSGWSPPSRTSPLYLNELLDFS